MLWVRSELTSDCRDALLELPPSADVSDTAEELEAVLWGKLLDAFSGLSLLEARLDLGGCCHSLPSNESFRRASMLASPVQVLSLRGGSNVSQR